MSQHAPDTTLDTRFSESAAEAIPWDVAEPQLVDAGIYWLGTVRPDGRPHVTPLIGLWQEDGFVFGTGPGERKARNLVDNHQITVTTGSNTYESGLDIVVEGEAVRVRGIDTLRALSEEYVAKYGEEWRFDVVSDEGFGDGEHLAWVFRVEPRVAFGFNRNGPSGQTKWDFR